MLRRIVVCLGLVLTIVIMLPFATSTAHNLRSQVSTRSHRFHHHSRSWWRRHRALWRHRQAMIARRRALQATARQNAPQVASQPKAAENHAVIPSPLALPETVYRDGNFALPLPTNWSPSSSNKSGSNFRIAPPNGPEAQATLAVVAVAP